MRNPNFIGCNCRLSLLLAILLLSMPLRGAIAQQAVMPPLPEIPREFRGVWVATVANIDWPTRPGLSTDEQQREADRILDLCKKLRLNVVVLQVRTSCDALYASKLEPWSYYLTGEQGKPPEPFYDPLSYWIEQAHARGLELHAWFNPYRAKNSGQSYIDSKTHISNTHPDLVKRYGNDKTNYLWLDPGEEQARTHTLDVFMDVVERYDIDGIHIDDYFYPYPIDDIPFPDDPAWNRYINAGGSLGRDDWRRDQMNQFIREVYARMKARKPHVKFGISPFGIWKPGFPQGVQGFSQYDKLYADAKLWLNEGWCDYYSPQLYWPIHSKGQSFPTLLQWWVGENTQQRIIAPGLFTSRIGDKNRPYSVEQIEDQVFLSRNLRGASGSIHFSMKAMLENREGLSDRLEANTYLSEALVPQMPWIDSPRVSRPQLKRVVREIQENGETKQQVEVRWNQADDSDRKVARRWCVYVLQGGQWSVSIQGADSIPLTMDPAQDPQVRVRAIAVAGVDGAGGIGEAAILSLDPETR